jgi:hypothetical protein
MNPSSASLLALCLAASVTSPGCTEEDPLPPVEVRSRISIDLGNVLREANLVIQGTRAVLPAPAALALFERAAGITTPIAQAIRSIAIALAIEPDAIDDAGATSYLNSRVFDDASYLGDGIYRVLPSLLCTGVMPDPGEDPSQVCAARLAELDLRIRVARGSVAPGSSPSDGSLEFALQVGAAHDEPVTITLTHTALHPSHTSTFLTASFDLDVLQRTLGKLIAAVAPSLPPIEMAGQVTVKVRTDPTGAQAALEIDRPISIRVAGMSADVDAADAFTLSSGASEVFHVVLAHGSGFDPVGSLYLRLGETAIKLPARADGARLDLHLAGLTADAAFNDYLPLLINHIGLGDRAAVISVDGVPAETIEINPEDGGELSVLVQRDEASPTLNRLNVYPKLDLRIATDRAALGDIAPVYDITRVLLDGTLRTTAVSDRLEVTAGSYSIATDPAGHGFAATVGQCVTGIEARDPDATPFIQWTVGTCD